MVMVTGVGMVMVMVMEEGRGGRGMGGGRDMIVVELVEGMDGIDPCLNGVYVWIIILGSFRLESVTRTWISPLKTGVGGQVSVRGWEEKEEC